MLQTVENRLFSEGLHVLGRAPDQDRMGQYLSAYFDGSLKEEVIDSVAAGENLEQIRQRLESSLSLVIHPPQPCLSSVSLPFDRIPSSDIPQSRVWI